MDSSARDRYLAALGITQWQRRDQALFHRDLNNSEKAELSVEQVANAVVEKKETNVVPEDKTADFKLSGIGNVDADCLLLGNIAVTESSDSAFAEDELTLVNNMFSAIGLPLADVFIVKPFECLASALRDPQEKELQACYEYLYKHIIKVQPKVIFTMHQLTAQVLLKTEKTLTQLREKPAMIEKSKIIVTFSPAHLLKKPVDKAKAWQDLKQLKSLLEL